MSKKSALARLAHQSARIFGWRSRYNRLQRNARGEVRNTRRAKGSSEANRRKQEYRRARQPRRR